GVRVYSSARSSSLPGSTFVPSVAVVARVKERPGFQGVSPSESKTLSRQAAETNRLAACAPEIAIETLIEHIDWSPFFHTWELRGRYPAIFDDPTIGKQARELFDD